MSMLNTYHTNAEKIAQIISEINKYFFILYPF